MNKIPILDAALHYAAAGFPVFPLAAGTKVPHKGTHGQNDATTDAATIRRWWAHWPGSNVACLTGKQANLFVLDVDIKHGGYRTFKMLQAEYGSLPPTLTVKTPSGGRHFWFRWPDTDADIRNSTSRVGPGIDVKANLGSIIAPPSEIIDLDEDEEKRTRRYSWVKGGPKVLAAPPDWLVRLAMPPERPQVEPSGPVRYADAYVAKIVEGELKILSEATNGTRNATLNRCAWNVGKLVKSGTIPGCVAFSTLMSAAYEIGLPEREARMTINSAFRKAPTKEIQR